jgi:predicted ester cyclase
MSESNKALVRHYIEEVLNAGVYERLEEFIGPEYVNRTAGTRGPEGYRQNHLRWRAGFPDFHITIEDIVAEGDIVAIHMIWSGTHTGEFRGIAPTGRRAAWASTQFRRIAHGMVVEGWGVTDYWRLLQELGVAPNLAVTPTR